MRWRNLVLWVVALALIALVGALAWAESDRAARLRANGHRTPGTISAVNRALRWTSIDVRYETPTGVLTRTVYVPKATSEMKPGHTIVVIYDPKRPGYIMVAGRDNPSNSEIALGIALLVSGGICFVTALTSAWHMRVRRHVLRSHPWQPATISTVLQWTREYPVAFGLVLHEIPVRLTLVIDEISETVAPRVYSNCWAWSTRVRWLREGPIWICGDPASTRRAVIAKPGGTGLVLVKP
jgi:hypothetical protein